MLNNKGLLSKVQKLGTYNKTPRKRVLIGTKKKKSSPSFKQYGDKGYKPSTGRGVGY